MSDEEVPPETKPDTDNDPLSPATSTGTGNNEDDDEMLEGFPSAGSSADLAEDVLDVVAAVSEEAADGGDGGADTTPSEDQPPQAQAEAQVEMSPSPGTPPNDRGPRRRNSSFGLTSIQADSILFDPSNSGPAKDEWLKSASGDVGRTLVHAGLVTRLQINKAGPLGFGFLNTTLGISNECYVDRTLALFKNPNMLLVLRKAKDAAEVKRLLDVPAELLADMEQNGDFDQPQNDFLVAESVVDLNMCKMRLSRLTTPTSLGGSDDAGSSDGAVASGGDGTPAPPTTMAELKRRTCFEIASPSETLLLSAAVPPDDNGTASGGGTNNAKKKKKTKNATTKTDTRTPGPATAESLTDRRAYLETSAWEQAIIMALHAANAPSHGDEGEGFETDQAWKHVIVRGTLHSHVVYGDVDLLSRTIEIALSPPIDARKDEGGGSKDRRLSKEEMSRILDERDEFGLTALMYACTRRLASAVRVLVNAGANASVPTPRDLKTPSHLTAECLDEKSLSTVLSTTYPSRPDPNALDAYGRTPMYLAAVCGRTVEGGSNAIALGRCLSAIEAWGGQMFIEDPEKRLPLRHPVAVKSQQWKSTVVEAIFDHVDYYYPLKDETTFDQNADKSIVSIGQLMHYPLHTSLITLRQKIKAINQDGLSHGFEGGDNDLVNTLRVLILHGFDVNERLDRIDLRNDAAAELNVCFGFTPLQILAVAALDVQQLSTSDGNARIASDATIGGIMRCVSESAKLLVRYGGRISVAAPPTSRSKKETSSSSAAGAAPSKKLSKLSIGRGVSEQSAKSASSADDQHEAITAESPSSLPPFDRSQLCIDENATLVDLLGGEKVLREAKNEWHEEVAVRDSKTMDLTPNLPKEEMRGDANSCTICWKTFGTVSNRRHSCRITRRYVCDECSTKRMYDSRAVEHRISDGQFPLAQVEGAKMDEEEQKIHDEERAKRQEEKKKERTTRLAGTTAAGGMSTGTGDDNAVDAEKQELFGGAIMKNMKSLIMGEEEEEEEDQLQSVTAKLSATRDAFNERGERLDSLAEKTAALQDASKDFASMAKELRKQQESKGIFGGFF
eukprot:CAMPEP_0181033302 /NCGR_PEP_ID=MMETSP1070-20121207/7185_1 /TAXON_ID=265543 /ORGANISM="Minutocellus polymorphus, Strain NH13" /LENGTH=1070 /DNA_ID=CAMNT_0023110721 /DNA_START=91 /DNA_END=3306 /DNA_ORIENTATION=-